MGALRFIGFLLVAAVVIAGLDYYQQDKKTDSRLSFNGYVDTINDRFNLYQAELAAEEVAQARQKRWKEGPKPHLPASGETWVRRAIVDADYARDAREGVLQDGISEAAQPLAKKLAVQEAQQLAIKLDRTSAVYEDGKHTVWLQMRFRQNAKSNTLVGNISMTMEGLGTGTRDYTPFGLIGGVAYFQFARNKYSPITVDDRSFWSMVTAGITDLKEEPSFDIYKATIGLGEEIRLQLYSDAPASKLRGFLEQLDYDQLNSLLSMPVPGVGNGANSDPEREGELAAEMAGLRKEFVKLRRELAQLRLENMDELSLMANTLAGQYGLPNDAFDLTANRIDSSEDLVQVGYRKGLADILEGEIQKAESDGGGVLGRLFAKIGGDSEPEGEVPQGVGGGFLSGLMSVFSGSGGDTETVVRVNKGGSGSISECQSKGAFKRCTLGGG